ncbi:MAG: alpha/beta hydrolase [Candidatus Pacebacteria bacterium]|nr:alpha/beta hydrolase [Candidatus Paceibacterota bacterium]
MDTEEKLRKTLDIPIKIKQSSVNGYQINYAKIGKGEPLLLLHGANFGWGVWYPNIPELAKHFTVYAIDLPGAGRSTKIDYGKMDLYKDMVDTVDEFIHKHNLEKFHVIGCSAGGWIGFRLALRYPDKVRKIVAENTAGFSDGVKIKDRIIGVYPFAKFISKTTLNPNRKNKKNIEKFLMSIFYDGSDIKKEFVEYFLETMETSHNLLFISRMTALWRDFLLKRELPNITNKTLIVWGEQDKIMPLSQNAHNFKLIPNVQVEIIRDAGHIPSLEKASVFNSLVVDFLR